MTEAGHPAQLIRRQVGALVEECVRDFRVTIVDGPRQAGKATLLRQLHAKLGGTFVTFDDADQRAAAQDDPGGLSPSFSQPLAAVAARNEPRHPMPCPRNHRLTASDPQLTSGRHRRKATGKNSELSSGHSADAKKGAR